MTIFTELSIACRSILAGATFLAVVSLFALVLYGISSRARAWTVTLNAVLFLATTGFAAYVMCVAVEPENNPLSIPWLWLLVIAAALFVYGICAIAVTRYKQKDVLSPSSVKETLDNLDSGVCFADGSGRIILVNRAMAKLSSVLIGSYPQTINELKNSLEDLKTDGVEKVGNFMYRFPDGRVWRFVIELMTDESLNGFTQVTAQDVTEIYHTNEEIRAENEKLKEAIEEMKKLMVRLADRVREQETLALKIRIHNDIGASLLALSQILSTGNDENAEEHLRLLQHAVWHFSGSDEGGEQSFGDVKETAKKLGITLSLKGNLPAEDDIKKIILLAAKECVTNCYKHAGGKTVTVAVTERKDLYTVTVTNDGAPPKEPIKEGGGLTSLRETVENAGGEMHVSHAPNFVLILNLPKGGKKK